MTNRTIALQALECAKDLAALLEQVLANIVVYRTDDMTDEQVSAIEKFTEQVVEATDNLDWDWSEWSEVVVTND